MGPDFSATLTFVRGPSETFVMQGQPPVCTVSAPFESLPMEIRVSPATMNHRGSSSQSQGKGAWRARITLIIRMGNKTRAVLGCPPETSPLSTGRLMSKRRE
jgi:hypothetical protein